MKKLFKLLFLIQVLVACSPDDLVVDPEDNIPPKIRTVEVIKNDISDVYSFQYNEDNSKLISVLRNGVLYASLSYSANYAKIEMLNNAARNDTFVAKLSSNNYIDSLNNISNIAYFFGLGNPTNIVRGVNGRLFESQNYLNEYLKQVGVYTPMKTFTENHFYNTIDNNLRRYDATASLGGFNVSYKDSLVFNESRINQPNLPDQFITNMQTYFPGQGIPLLSPLFLLQQSNYYPYRTHTNLIQEWQYTEAYINIFSIPPTSINQFIYQYNYSFDGLNRVNQMDVSVDGILNTTYVFQYTE